MNEDVKRALEVLRLAIVARSSDVALHASYYRSLVRMGAFDEAVREFSALVRVDPDMTQFHFELIALSADHTARSLYDAFRRVLEAEPGDAHLWYGLGMLCQRMNLAEVIQTFRRGIEAAPSFAPLHYNLGVALLKVSRDESLREHRKAISLSPTFAEPHLALAMLSTDHRETVTHLMRFLALARPYLKNYITQAQVRLTLLTGESGGA